MDERNIGALESMKGQMVPLAPNKLVKASEIRLHMGLSVLIFSVLSGLLDAFSINFLPLFFFSSERARK